MHPNTVSRGNLGQRYDKMTPRGDPQTPNDLGSLKVVAGGPSGRTVAMGRKLEGFGVNNDEDAEKGNNQSQPESLGRANLGGVGGGRV